MFAVSPAWISAWLPTLLLFFLLLQHRKKLRRIIRNRIKNKKGGLPQMEAIIEKYLHQGVTVTTIDSTESGRLTAYRDGWMTLTRKGKDTELNCDYIIKIAPLALKDGQ